MNQLKDWQSRQNVIVYINSNDTTTNLLSKFKEFLADVCEMTIVCKGASTPPFQNHHPHY